VRNLKGDEVAQFLDPVQEYVDQARWTQQQSRRAV
jgi:hypothetical protein